jgi:predicted GNAT family acetyltransferase
MAQNLTSAISRCSGRAVSVFPRPWGMRLRLFEARTVQPLSARPSGQLRVAEEADRPIIAQWARAFRSGADPHNPADPDEDARRRINGRSVFVSDDGRPVSMAAWGGRTGRGVRVNFVYTPPEHRGRGVASACVADLTQHLLTEGHAFCCLFTDLANPTSNRIYQRIGYQPVCDMSDILLEAG